MESSDHQSKKKSRTPLRYWLNMFVVLPLVVVLLAANILLWQTLRLGSTPLRDGGSYWTGPEVRREFISWRVCGPLALSIAASVLLLLAARMGARRAMEKQVLRPADELTEAGSWVLATALGGGKQLRLPGDGKPVEDMTPIERQLEQWLTKYRREVELDIASRTKKMQRDLELAKDFQRAMLERPYPNIPEIHIEGRLRLDFYHRYEPAAALGGDFFDILTLGPDCAGVFIADVMGHGTRSALITAILRTLLGDLIQQGRNAPHFLSEVNKAFCQLLRSVPSPLFASAFYFVADTTGRVATFSSAGHPAGFRIIRSLSRISRLEVPPPRGTALGVIPEESYTGGHCRLLADDAFVFYTDGVYEVHNKDGEEFGMERMQQALRKLMYKNTGEKIVDGLLQAVRDFAGEEPIADDICIVAVEVTTESA